MRKNGLSTTTTAIALRSFRMIVMYVYLKWFDEGDTRECSRTQVTINPKAASMSFLMWLPCVNFMTSGKQVRQKTRMERVVSWARKACYIRDLGLFLFMYLGDGQNLADTAVDMMNIYATHGKQLRFLRHKTRERNESASEVIFPVTPEMQEILNRYGNAPPFGGRGNPVFQR